MFDKEKFYKNVSYMAKQRNIAMGEIEDKLEISHGYIAKLGRPNSPLPSIDYITKIADLLDISIDLLVDGDLGNLSTQEQFIIDFLHKLIILTKNNAIDWLPEKMEFFSNDERHGYISKNYFWGRNLFESSFRNYYVIPDLTAYFAKLPNEEASVMVVKVGYSSNDPEPSQFEDYDLLATEIYIVTNGDYNGVCSSEYVADEIKNEISKLDKVVCNARSKIGLKSGSKEIISRLLNNTDDNGNLINNGIDPDFFNTEEDIPFQ